MAYHMKLVQKHGHIYISGFGPWTRIAVMEPDIIADVLSRSNSQDFLRTTDNGVGLKTLVGTRNLVMTNGLDHDRARKMVNPAFHFVKLPSIALIMINQTAKAIDKLLKLSSENQFIDLQREFQKLTLAIIASSTLGNGFENMDDVKETISGGFALALDAVQYRVLHLIDHIPIISRLPFWYKSYLDKGCRDISEFVEQTISDRRHGRSISQSSGADLLDLLLSAIDDDGKPFDNQEITDLAKSFLFSGHETTGNLMTWTMYVLMTNKDVWRACQDEVDRVLPDGIEPTYEHLSMLVVCEAVLQETLRLYPTAPFFTRQCIHEHIVSSNSHGQLRIPVGTTIILNAYALHRRDDFWPRPLEFDYTRWMRDPVSGLRPKLAHPFCYLPFGAGPRNCIAQNFALLEAKIILAMFVQRCDFEMEPGQKITPDIRLTMRSKYGLRARVNRRQ
ncbi:unnamed protein product [Rotaria sp. Silwood1]|nr:unnamed protein product [Rotaria sp. Silwood1]CAF1599796.1 unnamed protein product [Rotaria sp. Silwood1]CAF4945723.1 unnamed protein product [Rotaria sp. Silwood1]